MFEIVSIDTERDLKDWAAFLTAVSPTPRTTAQIRDWLQAPFTMRQMYKAVLNSGKWAGYLLLQQQPAAAAGELFMWMTTHPEHRRQGAGKQLYRFGVETAQALGYRIVNSQVRDDDAYSLAFAQKCGFQQKRHAFRSRLDLATFDERPFASCLYQASAAGIRLTTLAELGDTPQNRRQVYELNKTTSADIPGRGPFFNYEAFVQSRLERSWFIADGLHLALHGEEWVGLALVSNHAEQKIFFNEMTGVIRPYRGHRIAQALKLKTIKTARRYGAASMVTFNDSENAPMLAINRKFGFMPMPGFYLLELLINGK